MENNILHKSLRALFDYATSRYTDNKFLNTIGGDGYTYKQFGEESYRISELLTQYHIGPDDKVGIISQNMPNWGIAFFSISAFGRVAVPMLPDFSVSDIKHILKHSECKALFVSEKLLPKIHEKALGRLSLVVKLDDFSVIKGEIPTTESGEETPSRPTKDANEINSEDLATIIYTSGTTGSSKGVMLSHKNLCADLFAAEMLRPSFDWDVWLSILPLSHTLEFSLCLLLPMNCGASVYYIDKAPTPSVLMHAFATVRPTTILSVPLIIEKIYKGTILPKFEKSFILRILYKTTLGRKMLHKVAGKELMKKFGGRVRFFGIGGSKLDRNVERFLFEAKFPYAIGYGMTESAPLLAGAAPSMVKIGSTGPQVYGMELKIINPDPKTGIGEIVARGDNVMMGYYKNPEATAETLEGGWLHTKDLGIFDNKGWLYILGRSSNTIIGPSGENIYPEAIESVINSHNLVSESIVTEGKGGRLRALIHFNQEKLKAFLESKDENEPKETTSNPDESKLSAMEKFENLKKEIIEYVNSKVNKFSQIGSVDEQKEEFEKTATQKIKRYLYNLKK